MADELLHSRFSIESIFCTEQYFQKVQQLHQKRLKNTQIHLVSDSELKKLSALSTPNEVLAVVSVPERPSNSKKEMDFSWTLVLDGVQDPGNMGTILRIADWFAIPEIKLSADCADVYNPKVVQATMGSIFRVEIEEVYLEEYLEQEKRPIFGAVLGGENIYTQTFPSKGVLVLGNESKGISALIRSKIEKFISIPAFGSAESLNVAVAAAIFCSEISRNR